MPIDRSLFLKKVEKRIKQFSFPISGSNEHGRCTRTQLRLKVNLPAREKQTSFLTILQS